MSYHNILVPYDKSQSAKNALEEALGLSSGSEGSKVTVLNVTDIPNFNDATFEVAARMSGITNLETVETERLEKNYVAAVMSDIETDTADITAGRHDRLEFAVAHGKPSRAIVSYANDKDCDLIVMGCRGLSAVSGMLGSVSYAVLRGAECPVMVVK